MSRWKRGAAAYSAHTIIAAAEFGGGGSMSSSPETKAGSSKRKWVSEIRLPNSRECILLGSYDAPEKTVRAFDAAFVCIRGHGAASADLNFSDSRRRAAREDAAATRGRCTRWLPSRPSRQPRHSSWTAPTLPMAAQCRRRTITTLWRTTRAAGLLI